MKDAKIRVLIVRPNQEPEETWIQNELKSLQATVNGKIAFLPFDKNNQNVEVMHNSEYLFLAESDENFQFNRFVKSDYHTFENRMALPQGVPVFGTFAITRINMKTGWQTSLTDKDVKKYKRIFKLAQLTQQRTGGEENA